MRQGGGRPERPLFARLRDVPSRERPIAVPRLLPGRAPGQADQRPPPADRRPRPGHPPELARCMDKLLSNKPHDRFQTASEAADAPSDVLNQSAATALAAADPRPTARPVRSSSASRPTSPSPSSPAPFTPPVLAPGRGSRNDPPGRRCSRPWFWPVRGLPRVSSRAIAALNRPRGCHGPGSRPSRSRPGLQRRTNVVRPASGRAWETWVGVALGLAIRRRGAVAGPVKFSLGPRNSPPACHRV